MALSKFESIPAEIREAIFKILFHKSRVTVQGEVSYTRNELYFETYFDDDILYTSKLLYKEARPILASSLKLQFFRNRPSVVKKTTRAYYYPRIKKLTVEWYIGSDRVDAFDLSPFTKLENLNILPQWSGSYSLPFIQDEKTLEKVRNGALDEKFKSMARKALLQAQTCAWIKYAL